MALEIRIASPCSVKWESMTPVSTPGDQGADRQRHCGQCKLNVFNIKELTEAEVRALFVNAQGRVCGRIFRRSDGTVLTKDCPRGLAALRKKAVVGVMMAIAMVLTLLGVRLGTQKECPTTSDSWFDRTVGAAFYDVREELRATQTFGGVIDQFWPLEASGGRMVLRTHPRRLSGPVPVIVPSNHED